MSFENVKILILILQSNLVTEREEYVQVHPCAVNLLPHKCVLLDFNAVTLKATEEHLFHVHETSLIFSFVTFVYFDSRSSQ